jgi:hypothetical protein
MAEVNRHNSAAVEWFCLPDSRVDFFRRTWPLRMILKEFQDFPFRRRQVIQLFCAVRFHILLPPVTMETPPETEMLQKKEKFFQLLLLNIVQDAVFQQDAPV